MLGHKLSLSGSLLLLLFVWLTPPVQSQVAVRGEIMLGSDWNSEKRELDTVFPDQTVLDLGEKGIRTVQLWSEIVNGKGYELTWVVEYANGMRQEVWTQKIRYNRFRTYLEKTFRRKIWNPDSRKMNSVTGPCVVMLIDKHDRDKIIAFKKFQLR